MCHGHEFTAGQNNYDQQPDRIFRELRMPRGKTFLQKSLRMALATPE
jgi:hypothetical protein